MATPENPAQKDIIEVQLPSNMDPTIAVGFMALRTQLHATNRALREAVRLKPRGGLKFTLGNGSVEPIEGNK